jgi:hypothetical protein
MRALLAGSLLLLAAPAAADTQPVRAHYTGYVAGLPVLHLEAEFQFGADGRYQVATRFRTAGIVATFVSGEQVSRTEGMMPRQADAPLVPARYAMEGLWNGRTRRIAVDYERGAPVVRALEPPNTDEREPVPPEQQAGTVDVLTALAGLTRAVAQTGRCEGQVATFDGRRRTDFAASTLGPVTLPPERRSSFAGQTTLCRFVGRQVAGFHRTWDRTEAERPREGRAWIARVLPDAPPVPVRIEVESGFVGTATVHLTRVERGGELIPVSRPVR